MTNIEHWPDVEQLRIDLIETQTDYGREVAPGVILHYARKPEGDVLVSIEIERRPGRDLHDVSFERRDEEGNVVFQTLSGGAPEHVPGKKMRGDG